MAKEASHSNILFHQKILEMVCKDSPDPSILSAIFKQMNVELSCEWDGHTLLDHIISFWRDNMLTHSEILLLILETNTTKISSEEYQTICQEVSLKIRQEHTVRNTENAEKIRVATEGVFEVATSQLASLHGGVIPIHLLPAPQDDDAEIVEAFDSVCTQLESGLALEGALTTLCSDDIADQTNTARALLVYAMDMQRIDAVTAILNWDNASLLYNIEDEDNLVSDAITSFDCNAASEEASLILYAVMTHPAAKVIVDISYYETIINVILGAINFEEMSLVQTQLYQRAGLMCKYYDLCIAFADDNYAGNEIAALRNWFIANDVTVKDTQKLWVKLFKQTSIWQEDDPIMASTLDKWLSIHVESDEVPSTGVVTASSDDIGGAG